MNYSLYVHMPWCVKKCPYCDFNSYLAPKLIPQEQYLRALCQDLEQFLPLIATRQLTSIFFGGGTPSLFAAKHVDSFLQFIYKKLKPSRQIEITLEANPGTVDSNNLPGYIKAGVNRISLGAQSFSADKLKTLGRIHDPNDIYKAVEILAKSNLANFNIDIMYGLPEQNIDEAIYDLEQAWQLSPKHISWYQLTLEPNTNFYKKPPRLPPDETIWQTQQQGASFLKGKGFERYEISAFAKEDFQCKHNLNYWQFGDYLGIGAGAHSKLTVDNNIIRYERAKTPKIYLDTAANLPSGKKLTKSDLIFEFVLNHSRLLAGFSKSTFEKQTQLPFSNIDPILRQAETKGLIRLENRHISLTELGLNFLNDLQAMFLPKRQA